MAALHESSLPALPAPQGDDDLEFKAQLRAHYDRLAPRRDRWYARNHRYHGYLEQSLQALIPPGRTILELGCATGNLLHALKPSRAVGIDLSPAMVEISKKKFPELVFRVEDAEAITGPLDFDVIVASDLVGELLDIAAMLDRIHVLTTQETRLILTFHNPALEGMLRMAQRLGMTMPPARQNWIAPADMLGLLELSDFDVETVRNGLGLQALLPGPRRSADGLPAPLDYFNAVNVIVARRRPKARRRPLSCSVIIPCRNEVGNIEAAVARLPPIGSRTEILFIDGASTDGTPAKVQEMRRRYAGSRDIRLIPQLGAAASSTEVVPADAPVSMLPLGKGDAVRKGFEAASGDVLMILDADLTVPPEDLPRFYDAIASGKADFVNGSRLLYPMEERAMKYVNYVGNKLFSTLFTWMLGQRIRDTLCGTKALRREHYRQIEAGRSQFGEFDPFGDFDLLFGAARLGLRIIDLPVRYRRRRSGVTKVRVLRHGLLLLAMSALAFRHFTLRRWLHSWR